MDDQLAGRMPSQSVSVGMFLEEVIIWVSGSKEDPLTQ